MTETLPERFDLASQSPVDERLLALRGAVPEAFVEDRIDFDSLRRSLGDWIDPGPERFGLTWPGKAECMRVIQEPSIGTLAPVPDESDVWETTQNVIIEGENLEVLKLLQKAYYGKVKVIYIDPPYNTGKDFVYPDNFREGLTDYLRYSGQVDEEGFKLSANADTNGRYHSKWLSMMYPRLFLARNLLTLDGVIFISIDDHEVHHLRSILNEIFGEENFVENYVWESNFRPDNSSPVERENSQHILCFARDKRHVTRLVGTQKKTEGLPSLTKNSMGVSTIELDPDWVELNVPDGEYPPGDKGSGYSLDDALIVKSGRAQSSFRLSGRLIWSQNYLEEQANSGTKIVIKGTGFVPYSRKASTTQLAPTSLISRDEVGDVLAGNAELRQLFDAVPFNHPKPTSLLGYLVRSAIGDDRAALVLDFFAGSGSLGQAVMATNIADGGARSFIEVQLPEPINDGEYHSVAEITRERTRRAARVLKKSLEHGADVDLGFRSFHLSPSNFTVWNASAAEASAVEEQLVMTIDHLAEGATELSMLTELLLKAGYPLTSPVASVDFAGTPGFSVADDALLICLSRNLSIGAFEAMVEREPAMILALDAGFGGNDELKVNALQTVRARNQQSGSDIALRVV